MLERLFFQNTLEAYQIVATVQTRGYLKNEVKADFKKEF
jgi:hypothetical protein